MTSSMPKPRKAMSHPRGPPGRRARVDAEELVVDQTLDEIEGAHPANIPK
jgi:hypothetical protein